MTTMRNKKYKNILVVLIVGVIATIVTSCERTASDEALPATFSTTAEIFTDNFVGLGTDFYFPYLGAKPDVFSVDTDEAYDSEASIRIDVPNANDPTGNFAGAIFRVDGSGRNLTGFDALTFWAKASQAVTVNEFGFGQDFNGDVLRVVLPLVDLTTQWRKYTIPIPDPSLLVEERGMFQFAAGGIGAPGEEVGYTFWVDELKFEKLGTIAQSRPAIFSGEDRVEETFLNASFNAANITQTFNLASGINQTVIPSPFYFNFISSNPAIASVNELGEVSILGVGTAKVTAQIAGVQAKGSLTVDVMGEFDAADAPPEREAGDVISVFSNAYTNVNNLNFAIFNDANVQVEVIDFGGNQVVEYNNLSFVGLGWDGTVDVSLMTHLHLDVQISASTSPFLNVELIDFGPDNADNGAGVVGDDTAGGASTGGSQLEVGSWVGIDIPVNSFTQPTGGGGSGSPNLNNVARIIFVSNGSSVIIDNIYFYKQ
jgi:hypothetical protein